MAKKKVGEPQMELGAVAGNPTAGGCNPNEYGGAALVEFQVGGEGWRCNHMDLLAAEFGVSPAELPLFQSVASRQDRGWLIVRRLFGLQPALPSAQFNPEDFQEWSPLVLQSALGITRVQLQAELDAVRGAWTQVRPKAEDRRPKVEPPAGPVGEFHFEQEEILKRHGFTLHFQSREEGEWFAKRVQDYDKLLGERMTAVLARNALMTEWQLRQLDELLADATKNRQGSEDWRKNMKVRQEMSSTYERQLAQINTLAPWASAIVGKYAFTGVLSDLTRAIQEYHAKGETRLVDGMFTAMEIRVELRQSVQAPEPRYRAGLVVFANAARQGLWDPNWQSPFTAAELKKLDAGFRAALVAAGNEAGERVPDLEKEGAEGEYPLLGEVRNPKAEGREGS